MEQKNHGLQQAVPWRPRTSMHLKRARSMLLYGSKRYGRISHNKYTNPTAMADTTTKCMNILRTLDCCSLFNAGNQRLG